MSTKPLAKSSSRRALPLRVFFQDKYRRFVGLFILTVGVCIMVISILLLHSGPRIRQVELDTRARLTDGMQLKVIFDRPLEQKDYKTLVSLTPEAEFDLKVQGKMLQLTLKDNLLQAQEYSLQIAPEIFDQNGNKMNSTYKHTFKTKPAQYAYLQRNYEFSIAANKDADDIVYIADLSGNSEQLFSAERIRMFRANDRYAVIVVDERESDAMYTVDMRSRAVRKEKLYINGTIRELALSPQGMHALYTIEPDYNADDPASFEKYSYQLRALDLLKGEEYMLLSASEEPLRAESVVLNSDGQYALIKDLNGAFSVVSPYNDYDPVLLGAHTRTYGFDAQSEHIIFEDEGEFMTYRLADAVKEVRTNNMIITSATAAKGSVFTLIADYENGAFVTKLQKRNTWADAPSTVWTSQNQKTIISGFTESYDERYVALHMIQDDCQFDDYATASDCMDAVTAIYDTQTKQDLTTLRGMGLVWIP